MSCLANPTRSGTRVSHFTSERRLQILLGVQRTVGHHVGHRLFPKLSQVRLDQRRESPAVVGVAVQGLNPDRQRRTVGGQQGRYHLFQVGPVVAGIAIGDADDAWLFRPVVFPFHAEGGGVQVNKAVLNAVHAQGVRSHLGKHLGLPFLVQDVQRPAQAVIIEHLGCQPGPQQAVQGLVGEELRGQIEGASREAQGIQDHRLHRFPDTDLPFGRTDDAVNLFGQADFLTNPCHDAQMIQTLSGIFCGHRYPPLPGGYHKISFLACQGDNSRPNMATAGSG